MLTLLAQSLTLINS
jgi:hypothetical protein